MDFAISSASSATQLQKGKEEGVDRQRRFEGKEEEEEGGRREEEVEDEVEDEMEEEIDGEGGGKYRGRK